MWTDLYLKFADEAEANSVLYTTDTVLDEEGNVVSETVKPNYMNIDTIGVIYEQQEVVDPENPPEPVALPGWHVNVRVLATEDATPLEPYAVHPSLPRRVWG